MASWWFAVGATCHPSSYFDQEFRQPTRRHVPPVAVSNSVKSNCHTWFGAVGFDGERGLAVCGELATFALGTSRGPHALHGPELLLLTSLLLNTAQHD